MADLELTDCGGGATGSGSKDPQICGGYGGSTPESWYKMYFRKVGLKSVYNRCYCTKIFQTIHPVKLFILIQIIGHNNNNCNKSKYNKSLISNELSDYGKIIVVCTRFDLMLK